MTTVTLTKSEVDIVLACAAREMPALYGPMMDVWLSRPRRSRATYELDDKALAFVVSCVPWVADQEAVT